MEDKRKVLFTDGMSSDFLLIITDAPKEAIEKYCRYHNTMMEDGGHFELFDNLKIQYYVKELLDSEVQYTLIVVWEYQVLSLWEL